MENILVIVILAIIIVSAIVYIVKAKKKGVKCVGCPYAKSCGSTTQNGSCSCNCNTEK